MPQNFAARPERPYELSKNIRSGRVYRKKRAAGHIYHLFAKDAEIPQKKPTASKRNL